MRLIDRYIAGRFLGNFCMLLIFLFLFAVSIDLLLQLDEYVNAAKQRIGPEGSLAAQIVAVIGIVVNFHGPRIFQFYAYMLGLLAVGAMGFTLAQMHRNRELVALLSTGMRLHRVAMPIIVVAVGLNVLQLLNQEFMLPRLAPMLIRKHADIGRESVQAFRVEFTADGSGNLAHALSFDPQTNTLTFPTFLDRDEAGRTVRRVTADDAVWSEDEGAWRLTNGRVITPRTDSDAQTTDLLVGQPIDRYPTDLTPDVLTMRRYRQFATMLSISQIREMLRSPGVVDADALVRFAIARFTTVLINIVVLVMVLPYFLLREPADLLHKSLLCAAMAIPASMGALLGLAMPLPGIPPVLGVFLPVLVLTPVALFMVSTIKT